LIESIEIAKILPGFADAAAGGSRAFAAALIDSFSEPQTF
jgi:hypothetical protein